MTAAVPGAEMSIRARTGRRTGGQARSGLHAKGTYTMAKFMILIFGDDDQWAAMSPEEERRIDAGHRAFAATAGSAILAGEQLDSPKNARTLRAGSSGRVSVTDGPFLETKEAVGGFYLIEAADAEAAVALASGFAEVSGGHSWVEVRPVVDNG
jgi:hypothetical protein